MLAVKVKDKEGNIRTITCDKGEKLRDALLENGISPYSAYTSMVNCKGNGLCGTCGVYIKQNLSADQWRDKLAKRFDYPRLSCQIKVEESLDIEIPKKIIWGKRDSSSF